MNPSTPFGETLRNQRSLCFSNQARVVTLKKVDNINFLRMISFEA